MKPLKFDGSYTQRVRHTFHYDMRAAALLGVFGGAFFPFILIVGRKIGATDLQMAALAGAPYIANAVALFFAEDLFGKGRVWYIVWPNAVGRALLVGMFFVADPALYTILIFLYMFVTAVPFPSYAAIMKSNYPEALRARLMSYVRAAMALMWIVSSAVVGWLLERGTSGYRYLFPLAAVFGVASALQYRKVRVAGEKREKEPLGGIERILSPLRSVPFRRFLWSYSVFEFALLLAAPVYPLVLVDEARITNFAAGLYGSVFSGAWLMGFFFWGRFMDRASSKATLGAVAAVGCATPLIYLATHDVVLLGAGQATAGFLFAAIELAPYVLITRMAAHADVPRYTAANVAVGGIRGGIAPFLGTYLYGAAGAGTVFSASLVLGLAAVGLAFLPSKNER